MQTKEVYHKFALMCSRKEYSISDIRKKLQNWKLPESKQEEIIKDLVEENYINESRFAEAFVKDKFRFNKWGRQKIKYQLKQKQITEENIETAFEQISQEDYSEMIEKLLESKNKSVKAKSDYERKGKLLRFMAQRGFEIEEVNNGIEKIINPN